MEEPSQNAPGSSGHQAAGEAESSTDRLHARIEAEFQRVLELAKLKGKSEEDSAQVAVEITTEAMANTADAYADALANEAAPWVAESHDYQAGFEQRLRAQWGEALDLYMSVVAVVDSTARETARRHNRHTHGASTKLFDLLHQLNGQALRVAREVFVLLQAGYPLGAIAASRTLYELAARAAVLSDFGQRPEHADLAERYIHHAHVANLKDLLVYQRDAAALGYQPFDQAFENQTRAKRDALVNQYGPEYKDAYGWAVGLPGITSGRDFSQLERIAELEHRRGPYMWSSHLVHADSKALGLGQVDRGGLTAVLTNSTNQGLADPAEFALFALQMVFVSLIDCAEPKPAWADLYTSYALRALVARAQDAFVDAKQVVEEAEERLQAELAEPGQRMTPWGIQGLIKEIDTLTHADPTDQTRVGDQTSGGY